MCETQNNPVAFTCQRNRADDEPDALLEVKGFRQLAVTFLAAPLRVGLFAFWWESLEDEQEDAGENDDTKEAEPGLGSEDVDEVEEVDVGVRLPH